MRKILLTICASLTLQALAADRKDVARHIFEFLRKHAVRDEFDPLQYSCNVDPYEMHWCAKKLYGNTPLDKIKMPDSVFDRGCYEPYNIFTWLEHDGILLDIHSLIQARDE